jgi:hypothetical protein
MASEFSDDPAPLHERHAFEGRVDPDAPVQADGEILISASPARVWSVIADVERWPAIRSDIQDVASKGPAAPGVVFRWSAGGIPVASRFGIVEPGKLLTYSTTTPGLVMVHRYDVEPRDDGGSRLVLRESMDAPAAPQIGNAELRERIASWLAGIKAVAEQG